MPKNEASSKDTSKWTEEDLYKSTVDARPYGSPTYENLEYFVDQLKRQIKRTEKLTFRQWIHKMENFLDLID